MPTDAYEKLEQASPSQEERRQEPFMRVAPVLKCALLMGAGGGFLLASVLTLTCAFAIPPARGGRRWHRHMGICNCSGGQGFLCWG